ARQGVAARPASPAVAPRARVPEVAPLVARRSAQAPPAAGERALATQARAPTDRAIPDPRSTRAGTQTRRKTRTPAHGRQAAMAPAGDRPGLRPRGAPAPMHRVRRARLRQ